MKISQMQWPCRLRGRTTGMNKKPRRIDATIEGFGDVRAAVFAYMARRQRAWEWLGCEIEAITPLGQVVKVLYEPGEEKRVAEPVTVTRVVTIN